MRFGLVGTGHWARVTHAPAIAAAEGTELSAVWGRSAPKAAALAAEVGARAYDDFEAMLGDVDAVAFSVPPDVQARLAAKAAEAGRHLLLDKPLALTDHDASAVTSAVDAAGVASVVFFTARFQPDVRSWLADVTTSDRWDGGTATWLGSAFAPDSPYAESPWRRDKGGLWDVGPHALSVLVATLGPVDAVVAERGRRDTTQLLLRHSGGPTSTATLSIDAPPAAAGATLELWGERGRTWMPAGSQPPEVALRVAVDELVRTASDGRLEHPCDVRLGRHVVEVLAAAQRQLDDARAGQFSPDRPAQ